VKTTASIRSEDDRLRIIIGPDDVIVRAVEGGTMVELAIEHGEAVDMFSAAYSLLALPRQAPSIQRR
jgi:hypothetical protein